MTSCRAHKACCILFVTVGIAVCEAKQQYKDAHKLAGCRDPTRHDQVIGYSSLYGQQDSADTVPSDQEWAFRRYGPLSRFTMYKAWYYDGQWHDPGELKGLAAWYGHGPSPNLVTDKLLLGARRPHVPQNFTLYQDEVLVRAEVQWDNIMRWMNFTSNLGRYFAWGFPDVAGVQQAVVNAPRPGSYIAAFRGFEGKPLPSSQGGFKKRYIAQIGFVWAQRQCSAAAVTAEASQAAFPAAADTTPGKQQRQQKLMSSVKAGLMQTFKGTRTQRG